jgi:endoglucanase
MKITTLCKNLALAGCLLASASAAWSYEINAGKVQDNAGNPVQLRGVNWFGFETNNHVVHGLWARNWKDMITQMQAQGFNAVRLPFCPATLHGSAPPDSIDYGRNADLQGLSAIQVMDKVVGELSQRGMYVLLDHHTPDCQTISELWYTPNYSEQQWISDLRFVAQRYAGVPGVIGIDIKNEPHGAATWGTGNNTTDWNRAAERAAAAVLQVAPQWLIAVEGIGENPSCWHRTPMGPMSTCSRISTPPTSPATCRPSGTSTSGSSCRPVMP